MDTLTSRVVSLLRFPLIVAVIGIHCNLLVKNPELETRSVFYFLVFITMKLLCIAVPLFFFISGFLFFKEGCFDLNLYKKKLKSRLHTIFVPYILWNIIYFVILGVMQFIKPDTLVILHKNIKDFIWQDYLWIFWDISQITGLADDQRTCLVGAFWFLQCLFVFFLFSPIIYYIIKYLRGVVLLIIGILYFTDFIPTIPGIQCNAIVYYMFGAYLAINKIDFISILKRIHIQANILIMIVAIMVSYFLNTNNIIYCITDLFLQVSVFSITTYMIETHRLRESRYMVSCVFFIFAVHRLFSASLLSVSSYLIPMLENDFLLYLYYILLILLVIVSSLMVYQISLKLFPSITRILIGYR